MGTEIPNTVVIPSNILYHFKGNYAATVAKNIILQNSFIILIMPLLLLSYKTLL